MITKLRIIPAFDSPTLKALVRVTMECGLVIPRVRIIEGKSGLYVRLPSSLSWADKDKKREFSNHILATYVINHYIDDYQVPA